LPLPTVVQACSQKLVNPKDEMKKLRRTVSYRLVNWTRTFPIKTPADLKEGQILSQIEPGGHAYNIKVLDQSEELQTSFRALRLWHCDAEVNIAEYGGLPCNHRFNQRPLKDTDTDAKRNASFIVIISQL